MTERDDTDMKPRAEEPETFEDEEIERGGSGGRLRIFLLAALLATVGLGLVYGRSWWSRPPAPPPQVVKTEPAAVPAPSGPAETPQARTVSPGARAAVPAEATAPTPSAPTKGEFWVQVGAFANPKNAQRLGDRLIAEHYAVTIRAGESQANLTVVQIGAYLDRRQAETARVELEKKGLPAFVLRRRPG